MPVALNLVLGPSGSARVESLRERLRAAGLAVSGVPPHVTMAVVDAGDPGPMLAAVAGLAPTTLRLVHVGVFGSTGVAFVGIGPTNELVRLHDRTWRTVAAGGGCWPRYEPGTWVPHCTLAIGLTPDQLGRAVSALAATPLPFDVDVAALAVVDLDTGATLATARLTRRGEVPR